MAFLIRTIAVAKSGREIVRDRTVEKDELIIGRDPASDIHLPDLTVELQHVKLTDAGQGMIAARALGELPFECDGENVTEARIDPNAGAQVAVGPALLAISREADGPVKINIQPAPKAKATPLYSMAPI